MRTFRNKRRIWLTMLLLAVLLLLAGCAGQGAGTPLSKPDVGDTIVFGAYEQDNDLLNGKEEIEWIVLAKEEDRILVVSRYALDCRPYNTAFLPVTWETCALRGWLNGEFLNEAFRPEEQARIAPASVGADVNPEYAVDPGGVTEDRVFLLSMREAETYFPSDEARQCALTAYAVAGKFRSNSGNCWWWLRTPGCDTVYASGVAPNGTVSGYGGRIYTDRDGSAVRPAIWITIK